jgi:hypothetical protein
MRFPLAALHFASSLAPLPGLAVFLIEKRTAPNGCRLDSVIVATNRLENEAWVNETVKMRRRRNESPPSSPHIPFRQVPPAEQNGAFNQLDCASKLKHFDSFF